MSHLRNTLVAAAVSDPRNTPPVALAATSSGRPRHLMSYDEQVLDEARDYFQTRGATCQPRAYDLCRLLVAADERLTAAEQRARALEAMVADLAPVSAAA